MVQIPGRQGDFLLYRYSSMNTEEILEPAVDPSFHMICRTRNTGHQDPGKKKRDTVFEKRSHGTKFSVSVPPSSWMNGMSGAFGKNLFIISPRKILEK